MVALSATRNIAAEIASTRAGKFPSIQESHMRNIRPLRSRIFLPAGLLILLAAGAFDYEARSQNASVSQSTEAKAILEVIQWSALYGYDVGMKQPWYVRDHRRFVYLRVFSDRTAEAQNEWDQTIKKTVLTQADFDKVQYFLDRPDILGLGLDAKYDLSKGASPSPGVTPRPSYQTWDAMLQHSKVQQKIRISDFDAYLYNSDRDPQDAQKTAPNPLVKLGCTVEDLRTSVTGKESGSGREKQCQQALAK
jgi:hypothetical protein